MPDVRRGLPPHRPLLPELSRLAPSPKGSLMENLSLDREDTDWHVDGSRARVAPRVLAHLPRSGQSAKLGVLGWIRRKELEGCHAAHELVLLAVILDRVVMSKRENVVNSDAVGAIICRVHALWKAFKKVKKVSYW